MWEYNVIIKATGEEILLFGTSLYRACLKHGISEHDVIVLFSVYTD